MTPVSRLSSLPFSSATFEPRSAQPQHQIINLSSNTFHNTTSIPNLADRRSLIYGTPTLDLVSLISCLLPLRIRLICTRLHSLFVYLQPIFVFNHQHHRKPQVQFSARLPLLLGYSTNFLEDPANLACRSELRGVSEGSQVRSSVSQSVFSFLCTTPSSF